MPATHEGLVLSNSLLHSSCMPNLERPAPGGSDIKPLAMFFAESCKDRTIDQRALISPAAYSGVSERFARPRFFSTDVILVWLIAAC